MKKTIMHVGIATFVATLLIACGNSEPEKGKNLLEGQQQTLEKAKAVEDQLQKAAEERKQAIDE